MTALSNWVEFDPTNKETFPKEYGKYFIVRKDGQLHWESWNGTGWAYNHNTIAYWAVIVLPIKATITIDYNED